jgi:hypothetical protein
VVSNLASEYAKLFTYEGSRTDKHVREHEIYVVGHHEGALQKARDGMKDRASATIPNGRRVSSSTATGAQTVTLTIPSFVQDKKKLTYVAGGLAAVVAILTILVVTKKPSSPAVASEPAPVTQAAPATVPAAPVEAPKVAVAPVVAPAPVPAAPVPVAAAPTPAPADARKSDAPDSKVLSPAPSQVPPAAPAAKGDPKAADAVKAEGTKALDAAKSAEAAKAGAPVDPAKAVIQATLFLNISPWGEVFVNGKSQGVSPPKKFVKLDPGKYKIEVKNTTFPVHSQSFEVKAREEVTLKHRFQ